MLVRHLANALYARIVMIVLAVHKQSHMMISQG
jgi:hypothetical protein